AAVCWCCPPAGRCWCCPASPTPTPTACFPTCKEADMDDIRLKGHFHIVYILKIIRYGLILCLVPMIQALLNFDLESLYRALRQDAVILIAMAALGAVLWRRVGFALTDKALVLDMGILVR